MLIHANWSIRKILRLTWKTNLQVLLVTGLTTLLYLRWLHAYFPVPPFIISVLGTAIAFFIGFVYLVTYLNGQLLMNPFDNQPSDTPISSIIRTVEIDLLQGLGETNIPPPAAPVNNDYLM